MNKSKNKVDWIDLAIDLNNLMNIKLNKNIFNVINFYHFKILYIKI